MSSSKISGRGFPAEMREKNNKLWHFFVFMLCQSKIRSYFIVLKCKFALKHTIKCNKYMNITSDIYIEKNELSKNDQNYNNAS